MKIFIGSKITGDTLKLSLSSGILIFSVSDSQTYHGPSGIFEDFVQHSLSTSPVAKEVNIISTEKKVSIEKITL